MRLSRHRSTSHVASKLTRAILGPELVSLFVATTIVGFVPITMFLLERQRSPSRPQALPQ